MDHISCNCPFCSLLKIVLGPAPTAPLATPVPQHRRHPEGEPSPNPTPTIKGDGPIFMELGREPITLTAEHLMALRCSQADTLFAVFRLGGYSANVAIPVLQDFERAGVTEGPYRFQSIAGRGYVSATLSKSGRMARDFYASKGWVL